MTEPVPEPPVELGILSLTKKGLGVSGDSFDDALISFINSVLSDLTQLGLGPAGGFEIENDTAKWSDFIGSNLLFNAAKSYMIHRVRLMFDPPDNYFTIQAIKEQITKDEWRLNVIREDLLPPPVVEPTLDEM